MFKKKIVFFGEIFSFGQLKIFFILCFRIFLKIIIWKTNFFHDSFFEQSFLRSTLFLREYAQFECGQDKTLSRSTAVALKIVCIKRNKMKLCELVFLNGTKFGIAEKE